MADEWERITLYEWSRRGRDLCGPDPIGWRFICPSCGHVQTLQDFLDIGMPRRQAEQVIGFSCIGSWRRHKGCVVEFGDPTLGLGCRYHGGKEPNISPITLVIEEGRSERPTFGFAPEVVA